MINSISIKNYKSVENINFDLGRINVFIGENGSGKSNILEALALAGAAEARKLDNEFLASRGIRVSTPELMRSAFYDEKSVEPIIISFKSAGNDFDYVITNDNKPYSTWKNTSSSRGTKEEYSFEEFKELVSKFYVGNAIGKNSRNTKKIRETIEKAMMDVLASKDQKFEKIKIKFDNQDEPLGIKNFIIFSPENSSLRLFEKEGQIEPLGINGEGLFKLLSVLSMEDDKKSFLDITNYLKLFGWFESIKVNCEDGTDSVEIFDKFLCQKHHFFDQRSANEGFLFLSFYFTLFSTDLTPKFFAIDNIDASLNPKLCSELMKKLSLMAKNHDKQAIFTTHNPAILDGLDLTDDDQRLFVVYRGSKGQTKIRRVSEKPGSQGFPKKLSELFMSGILGGLPTSF